MKKEKRRDAVGKKHRKPGMRI
uniref:Uncharacterized protein n=1 Tax=Arundo donax TaxID=35708 RepID=A0A0A9C6X7_ARUDO